MRSHRVWHCSIDSGINQLKKIDDEKEHGYSRPGFPGGRRSNHCSALFYRHFNGDFGSGVAGFGGRIRCHKSGELLPAVFFGRIEHLPGEGKSVREILYTNLLYTTTSNPTKAIPARIINQFERPPLKSRASGSPITTRFDQYSGRV